MWGHGIPPPTLNLETPAPWSITYGGADFALRSSIAGAAGETLGKQNWGGCSGWCLGGGGTPSTPSHPDTVGKAAGVGMGLTWGAQGAADPPQRAALVTPNASWLRPQCFR